MNSPATVLREMDHYARYFGPMDIQDACLQLPQVKVELEHTFAEGVYVRTIRCTAGTFGVGKRHRREHINVLTKGRVLVYAGDGRPAREFKAPYMWTAPALSKKVVFVLEDCEWSGFHPTTETDVDKIEDMFIIPESEYVEMIDEQIREELSWSGLQQQ